MEQIGRYRVTGELGRGAMGVVYRAEDPAIGRTVAVKTIRLADLTDRQERDRLRDRLFREARSAGILSHPNIVTIYDIAEEGETAYVFMEFVDGPTLEHLLFSHTPPTKDQILEILRQTAVALDYAHSKGIVHRDIKPANIMVNVDGQAKITDFGVARILSQQLTQAGTIMGTPNYMSPEQVQGTPVDGRSDQFSLAVIAFEMLTGEKPYAADSLPTLLYKIAREAPIPPRRLNPSLGHNVDEVLERAFSKDPNDRYPNCAEFAAGLAEAANAKPDWEPLRRGGSESMETVATDSDMQQPTVVERPAPTIVSPPAAPEAPAVVEATPLIEAPAAVEATPLIEAPAAVEATPLIEAPAAVEAAPPVEEVAVLPPLESAAIVVAPPLEPAAEIVATPPVEPPAPAVVVPPPVALAQAVAAEPDRPQTPPEATEAPVAEPRPRSRAAAVPAAHTSRRIEQEPASSPFRTLLLVAAAIVVVAAGALGVWRLTRSTEPVAGDLAATPAQEAVSTPAPEPPSAPPPSPATSAPSITAQAKPEPASTSLRTAAETPSLPPVAKPAAVKPGAVHTVQVRSSPSGATVVADADTSLSCTTPCELPLVAGRHVLILSLAGHRNATRILGVPDMLDVTSELEAIAGTLAVRSNPAGAAISLNGRARSEKTPAMIHLPAGTYKIVLTMEGRAPFEDTVEVKDQVISNISVDW